MYYLINHKHKVIFGYTPKCACTSLKRWFIKTFNLDIELPSIEAPHHSVHDSLGYGNTEHSYIDPNLDLASYHKCALIRNPYTRLVSGFFDRNYEETQTPDYLTSDCFEQFVEKIYKDPSTLFKFHCFHHVPQTYQVDDRLPGIERMDAVFTVEDLSQWSDYFSAIAVEAKFEGFEHAHRKTHVGDGKPTPLWDCDVSSYRRLGLPANHSWFYNENLKSMVRTIYDADFNAFERRGISYDISPVFEP